MMIGPLTLFAKSCTHSFFGLEPWYKYLQLDSKCAIKDNTFSINNLHDISLILIVVVDDLLRIAGIIAVAYVIVGAFQYITSQGNPDATAKALNTIINALVGAAIAVLAIAFVSFLGNSLSG